MTLASKHIIVHVLIVLTFLSCDKKNEGPSSELNAPSINLSESTIEGQINEEIEIQVTWRALSGLSSISTDSNLAELPSSIEGTEGSFAVTVVVPELSGRITFTIIDNEQRQSTAVLDVSPSLNDIVVPLEIPVVFVTSAFEDDTMVPNVEPEPFDYTFSDPVCSNTLDNQEYAPGEFQNYIRDYFAMRTLRDCTDMHQGLDIVHEVDCSGERFDDANPPLVNCMCDGVVTRIDAENICSVYVTCDQGFANESMGSNIETIYRHLDSFADGLTEGQRINKEEPVGVMGVCEANLRHLHLSVVRDNPGKNINGARLFDPDRGGILKRLGSSSNDIRIVHCSQDTTIVRFAFPGNEWGLVQVGVMTSKLGNLVYNTEFVSTNTSSAEERDDPYFVDGIGFFAYPFNGESTTCNLYDSQKSDLCAAIPGSTQRGNGNYYPIECEGEYAKVTAVYDLVLLNFGCDDLYLEIQEGTFIPYAQDVWGHGVKATNVES